MTVWRVPVNVDWHAAGAPGVNVWHGRTLGAVPADDTTALNLMAAALHTFYNSLTTQYPPGTTITIDQATNVETQTGHAMTFAPITTAGGTSRTPAALQICIGWKTSLVARRGSGRTFIGPLAGGVSDTTGIPGAANVAAVKSAADTLVSASLADNGWALGVWGLVDRMPPGVLATPSTPRVLRDFLSAKVNDKFAVLRSRRD